MADDYDYDADDYLDMDDGWLYVEDEFDIVDELAEGQIADPGYAGTTHEIAFESYEYDLFGYWDDLEYADDAYWDYGLPSKDRESGQKRRQDSDTMTSLDRRKRLKTKKEDQSHKSHHDAEPLLFRSRTERNLSLKQDAPRVTEKVFAFMPDWKQRFADANGIVSKQNMPEAMKRAAEAREEDTPQKARQSLQINNEEHGGGDNEDDEGGGDWEDEDEEDGFVLDPEMLKNILRERLGAAGLEGMDEDVFMETIQKMITGGSGEDATGELANALHGEVSREGGDEAVSGWLSQQGVSLEEDDDASSIATAELPRRSQRMAPASSDDGTAANVDSDKSKEEPSHAVSSGSSSRKRAAVEAHSSKRPKKVKFEVPSSSEPAAIVTHLNDEAHASSEDPLASESTIRNVSNESREPATATTTVNKLKEAGPKSRKRKAAEEESVEAESRTATAIQRRSRKLERLDAPAEASSSASPAKRTKSAKTKGGG